MNVSHFLYVPKYFYLNLRTRRKATFGGRILAVYSSFKMINNNISTKYLKVTKVAWLGLSSQCLGVQLSHQINKSRRKTISRWPDFYQRMSNILNRNAKGNLCFLLMFSYFFLILRDCSTDTGTSKIKWTLLTYKLEPNSATRRLIVTGLQDWG